MDVLRHFGNIGHIHIKCLSDFIVCTGFRKGGRVIFIYIITIRPMFLNVAHLHACVRRLNGAFFPFFLKKRKQFDVSDTHTQQKGGGGG